MHCIDYSFCYSTFYFIKNSTQDFFIMILSYAYLPTLFISKVIFVLKGFFEKKPGLFHFEEKCIFRRVSWGLFSFTIHEDSHHRKIERGDNLLLFFQWENCVKNVCLLSSIYPITEMDTSHYARRLIILLVVFPALQLLLLVWNCSTGIIMSSGRMTILSLLLVPTSVLNWRAEIWW